MPRYGPIHIVYDERCLLHRPYGDHPEAPGRVEAILAAIDQGPLKACVKLVPSRRASIRDVELVHPREYYMRLEEACLSGKAYLDHPDNAIVYDTFEAVLVAAGSGLEAIDLIEAGEAAKVFCCVRPPGHHASFMRAQGFCFMNNAALAARYWIDRYRVERVAIFDFDAHHGNGIQEIFYDDPNVLYVSLHEDPAWGYPGTGFREEEGIGAGKGFNLNLPLPRGAGEEEVMDLLKGRVWKRLCEFAPGALIICAGFDAHVMDVMSWLSYTNRLYGNLGLAVSIWAERLCPGRLLAFLEGGYEPCALKAASERFLGGMSLII